MTDVVSSIPKDFGTSYSGGKNAIRKYAHKVATTAATTAIAATYLSTYTNANPITSIGSSSTSSSESSSSYDLKDDTTITDNTYYQLYFNPLELVGSFVNHSFPSSFSSSPSTVVSEDTVNSAQYHSSSSFLEDTIETMNESTSSSFSFSSLLQPRISSRGSPMFPSFSLLSSLVASATSSSSSSSSSSLSSSSEVISLNDTFFAPLLSSMNFNSSSASELHSSLESSLLFNRSSSDEDIISSSSPVTSDNSALFPWLDSDLQFLYSIPHPKSGYTTLSIVLLAFFITIIMILVVVGNLLVCIAITTEKSLKTVQNWFIASLAVSDLLLGLVIMPFSLAYELMGYWIFGELWCDIHHALDVLLCTASINNLCLISLDRYWSVTQAVEYLKKRTPSRAIAMICFVWIFSALVSLPPLVGWKKEMSPGECELSNDSGYVIYSSVGSFYGPAVVMVFVYVKIFFAARSRARKHVKKRKFLVQPEVTNDPIRDKSTTTTTCTSLSNPSPPDGAQNSDQCSTFPAANSTASNIFNSKDPSTNRTNNNSNNNNNNNSNSNNNNNNANDFNSSNVSSATQPMATRTVSSPLICTSGSVTTAIGRSSTERSSLKYRNESHHYGDSRPETPTTPTPKVTFSPNDTVFDADEGITNFCTPNDHHQCPSNCATPSVSPTTRSPPQIVVETPENKQLRRLSQICPTPNVSSVRSDDRSSINNHPVPPSSLLSTTSNRSNSSHNSGNNKEIDSREMNDMNYRRNSDNLDRPDENDIPVPKKKKCPKLRISIRGSNKNRESKSDKKNANEICALVSTISPGTTTTTLPSILRQNGGHPPIGSGNKMISADDDSDTVESPVSKSGSVALESKLYLSAPKLARSPYGSSMSIADYDDSDLCNESGESDSKSASNSSNRQSGSGGYRKGKRKGKVQYQTPPSSGHHTPSDAERHRRKVAKARERRATLILGLIMGSFIMAWVPFFVMYLLSGLCKRCTVDKLLKFGYWLGYCNSAINPIIYTVFNRDFRKAFRKILFK